MADGQLVEYLARRANDGREQPLGEHLNDVAALSEQKASWDEGRDAGWAWVTGYGHDGGKGCLAFLHRLRGGSSFPHQGTGALAIVDGFGLGGDIFFQDDKPALPGADALFDRIEATIDASWPASNHWSAGLAMLPFVIGGHHGGMDDASGLRKLLRDERGPEAMTRHDEAMVTGFADVMADASWRLQPLHEGQSAAFFARMLFSTLTDADFLNTEAFMAPWMAEERERLRPTARIEDLVARVVATAQQRDAELVASGTTDLPVNRLRREVLERCREAAELPPGMFSLAVPTSGGKTLSGLEFALRHAKKNKKRRVIMVSPVCSVTEQTAAVVRRSLARADGCQDAVLEHHSGVVNEDKEDVLAARLSSENWDAPVVVTTAVQFFETLFANRPSKSRKLHAFADAVVVIDEAQAFPPALLRPAYMALDQLVRHYGASVVLCTATQLPSRMIWPGLPDIHPIVPDATALPGRVERVRWRWRLDVPLGWGEVADEIASGRHSTMVVVNSRKDCRALYAEMRRRLPVGTRLVHLSTWQCPAHRSALLDEVIERLAAERTRGGSRTVVVSTSLIEAGVDISFPAVWRALAGLDSIVQAAGRCNREGELSPDIGEVTVFIPSDGSTQFDDIGEITRQVVMRHPVPDTSAMAAFFDMALGRLDLDAKKILDMLAMRTDGPIRVREMRGDVMFRSAAEAFQMIDDNDARVIVPWGGGPAVAAALAAKPTITDYREAQRFSVPVSMRDFTRLFDSGAVEALGDSGAWYAVDAARYADEGLDVGT